MKKIKIIYNPVSGRQLNFQTINNISLRLLDKGYTISKFITKKKYDATNETVKCCKEDWDIIIACGGDGTINEIARGIALSERKIPIAILNSGTINDFSNFLQLPKEVDKFCDMIINEKILDVDLGKINDNYFVNVAGAGLLTSVAHDTPTENKNFLGVMAYYLEALKKIPTFQFEPINVKIECEEYNQEEEILLFLLSNSSSIGGFKLMSPTAEIQDGYLDCTIIKKANIQELINIFISIFTGEHINHPKVEYFKTKKITIHSQSPIDVDVDGEYAGKLPATFEVLHKALKVFIP